MGGFISRNSACFMNTLIYLNINPILVKDVTNNLPPETRYKITYAKAQLNVLREGTILRQYCPNYHFYIELYEIRLKREFQLSYEILYCQLFLFFMLEGAISFTNDIGENLSDASKGICYATANADGEYEAHLDKGVHIFLYMAPRHDWLRSSGNFPRIVEFMDDTEKKGLPVAFMNRTVINRQLFGALVRLWLVDLEQETDSEIVLLQRCKQVLAGYHEAQVAGDYLPNLSAEDKVAELCQYLDAHCLEVDITDLDRLGDRFFVTPRTLRRLFLKVKGTTVRLYVESKRLEYAHRLLLETDMPIKDIAKVCGFNFAHHFSRLFRKKFFTSPKNLRKGL